MHILSKTEFELHVSILSWVRIAYSALLMLGGAFVGTLLIGIGAATHDAVAYQMLSTVGAAVGGLLLLVAVPGLVAGIGLLGRATWSRTLSLVLAAFDLVACPLGTVLAAYSVFVLSQDAAIEAFGACCSIEHGRLQAASA